MMIFILFLMVLFAVVLQPDQATGINAANKESLRRHKKHNDSVP
jgi:hypothetical protein